MSPDSEVAAIAHRLLADWGPYVAVLLIPFLGLRVLAGVMPFAKSIMPAAVRVGLAVLGVALVFTLCTAVPGFAAASALVAGLVLFLRARHIATEELREKFRREIDQAHDRERHRAPPPVNALPPPSSGSASRPSTPPGGTP